MAFISKLRRGHPQAPIKGVGERSVIVKACAPRNLRHIEVSPFAQQRARIEMPACQLHFLRLQNGARPDSAHIRRPWVDLTTRHYPRAACASPKFPLLAVVTSRRSARTSAPRRGTACSPIRVRSEERLDSRSAARLSGMRRSATPSPMLRLTTEQRRPGDAEG
jgi:hypothetical protein